MGINYSNLNNLTNRDSDNFNDALVKEVDSKLLPLVKDLDGNIKYTSVLSQEDFNTIKPDNDTVYFINNITDEPLSLTNILDVAVSWSDKESNKPEFIWMLTGDTEIEYVYLYKMPLESGAPELIKEYEGYIDGRLTFDGMFDYNEDHSKSIIVTNKEPFVILINSDNELFAFPSLKYKTKGSNRYKAIKIDGSSDTPVLTCSIDKGYCSDLFRKDDQGIVIAYSIYENGRYNLCYQQYGYPDTENPTVKMWGSKVTVCSKNESIYSVNIRRLSDYRLGLTYNYWETKNNVTISKTGFRYSDRIYAGVAYHPEMIEIESIPTLKGILYGAITNDRPGAFEAGKIPLPVLQLAGFSTPRAIGSEFDASVGQILSTWEFDMIYQLSSFDKPITEYEGLEDELEKAQVQLEILDPDDLGKIIYQKDKDIDLGELLGLTVESTWPYGNYSLPYDKELGWCTAAPAIKRITAEKSKLVITLAGNSPPATPFKIVPSSKWGDQINVRYRASDFNNEMRNLSGWIALTDFKSSSYGQVHKVGANTESATLFDFNKHVLYSKNFELITARASSVQKTFEIGNFHYTDSFSATIEKIIEMPASISTSIYFQVSGRGSTECKGVKNIDV